MKKCSFAFQLDTKSEMLVVKHRIVLLHLPTGSSADPEL